MDYSKSSPYAAPGTPIASSKRPRVNSASKGGMKSPAGNKHQMTNGASLQHPSIDPDATAVEDAAIEPCTPSKQLFSPGLRVEQPDSHDPLHKKVVKTQDMHHRPLTEHHHAHTHTVPILSRVDEHRSSSGADDSPSNVFQQRLERALHDENAPPAEEEGRVGDGQGQGQEMSVAEEDSGEVESEHSVDESMEDEFNPYHFMAFLPKYSSIVPRIEKYHLPPKPLISPAGAPSHPQTLVLDLDETLVHCTVEPIAKPDLIFPVTFNGTLYQVYVRKRPYVDYFLETVAKSFEVVLFTASQRVYADVLVDRLDPERKLIQHRLFRESCLLVQGNYLKDLSVLGRDFHKTVLVDNSPHAYGYQVDNGIPIESWYDDDNDTELLKLIGFLKKIQNADDVRPIVRDHFKTHKLIENAKTGLPTVLSAPPF